MMNKKKQTTAPLFAAVFIFAMSHLYIFALDYSWGWKLFELGLTLNYAFLALTLFIKTPWEKDREKAGWLAVFALCLAQAGQYIVLYYIFDVSLDSPEAQAAWGATISKAAIKRSSYLFFALILMFAPFLFLYFHCFRAAMLAGGRIITARGILPVAQSRLNKTDLFLLCQKPKDGLGGWRSMRVSIPASGFSFWRKGKRYVFTRAERRLMKVDYPERWVDDEKFTVINLGEADKYFTDYIIGREYRPRSAIKAFLMMGLDEYQDCRNTILYPALRMLKE